MIKLKAIHQAVALLNAAGAKFAIQFEEHSFGNAKLADPEAPRRTRAAPKYKWIDLYRPYLENCKPGDVFAHTVDNHEAAESLRGSLSSQLADKFGNGNYMCSVTREKVNGKETGRVTVEAMLVQFNPNTAGPAPGALDIRLPGTIQ